LEALEIGVEIAEGCSLKGFTFVGLPTAAVRESKERIFGALQSSGLPLPRGRWLINLAPADLKKEGVTLDLAIALGILAFGGTVPASRLSRFLVAGELALSGEVRAVRGALALGLLGQKLPWIEGLILPAGNELEVGRFLNVPLYPVRTLMDAVRFLTTGEVRETQRTAEPEEPGGGSDAIDLAEVRGQEPAKRALVVAAAGGHSVLMIGPPGAGKTLLARRMPGILPDLAPEQGLETALIHSVTGRRRGRRPLEPPFRAPHHTVSHVGLVGGGNPPRPGEVSLAHHGVLFLDEMPEFRRQSLEALRECIEERAISVVRAGASVRFPAHFQLVAAMNPCPCGFATHPFRRCTCSQGEVLRYGKRLSGALLDRIDLELTVGPVSPEDLESRHEGLSTSTARQAVARAMEHQKGRNAGDPLRLNAALGPDETVTLAHLDPAGGRLLGAATRKLRLSARAYHRTLRVARTIADLRGEEHTGAEAVAEALRYRPRGTVLE